MKIVDHQIRASDGIHLSYERTGSGPLLLCIPGLGYAAWSWRHQLVGLGREFEVVAFDNRGTGRSDKPAGPYSIEMLADDVVCALETLGCGEGGRSAYVVGASMGGYVALCVASTRPDLTAGLVLISTSVGGPEARRLPEATRDAWFAARHLTPENYARQTMKLSFSAGWAEAHPLEYEEILKRRLEYPTPPHAWAAQFEACERFLDAGAPAVEKYPRTLVIHGTGDRILPFENAGLTLEQIPDATMLRLEGAGHLSWIERPDEVNEAIRTFVGRSPRVHPNTQDPNA